MFNLLKASGRKVPAIIAGLGLAVGMVLASGAERAQASTVACGTEVAGSLTINLGCEVSTSATQDFLNIDPTTVNAEEFFGPVDWSYVGKKNVGGTSDGTAPTLTGTNTAQGGTLGILASLWSTYGQVMAIFKDGGGTYLTGFLLNTGDTSFSYVSPFLNGFENDGVTRKYKDVSHVSLYARGTGGGVTPPIPLPAGLPLMLTALGLVAMVRRKSRKAA